MTTAVEERLSEVAGADGRVIALRRWRSDAAPRAVLVVAHGMGEHAARYREPLAPLIAHGVSVYAYDHRGHGAQAEASGSLGDYGPGGFAAVVGDLVSVVQAARAENPEVPLTLLGHSMGSMIAQAFVLDHAALIDALVLSGSAAVDVVAAKGTDTPDLFRAMNAPFDPGKTGFEWLSRDQGEVERYAADPLCGFSLQPESMVDLLAQGAALADPALIAAIPKDLPIWIASGEADPLHGYIGALEPLVGRYRAAGLAVESRIYPGARHEILNETNRDEVVADLRGFIERVSRGGLSAATGSSG
jgi:alpha-beta hydrolase superfamily lysophospholipase